MAEPVTHQASKAGVQAFIKALSSYYRQMPSASTPGLRPQGVMLRSKLPNQMTDLVKRPSSRPPAEHYAHMLASHIAKAPAPKEELFKPRAEKIIHPGKQLTLHAVKAVHLSNPHIYKVKA
jgi:hypothetical protein